jgi:hypothetical protein
MRFTPWMLLIAAGVLNDAAKRCRRCSSHSGRVVMKRRFQPRASSIAVSLKRRWARRSSGVSAPYRRWKVRATSSRSYQVRKRGTVTSGTPTGRVRGTGARVRAMACHAAARRARCERRRSFSRAAREVSAG